MCVCVCVYLSTEEQSLLHVCFVYFYFLYLFCFFKRKENAVAEAFIDYGSCTLIHLMWAFGYPFFFLLLLFRCLGACWLSSPVHRLDTLQAGITSMVAMLHPHHPPGTLEQRATKPLRSWTSLVEENPASMHMPCPRRVAKDITAIRSSTGTTTSRTKRRAAEAGGSLRETTESSRKDSNSSASLACPRVGRDERSGRVPRGKARSTLRNHQSRKRRPTSPLSLLLLLLLLPLGAAHSCIGRSTIP